MSRKTRRMTALSVSLVAVLALAVAATSASAFIAKFENYNVNGTLTARKLNQTITLPTGSFNGEANLAFVAEPGGGFGVEGPLTGEVTLPPFEATIQLLGIPTKVGLTFTDTEPSKGSITSVAATECEGKESCEHLSVPTEANIGFTSIDLFGLKIPIACKTAKPVSLPLATNLTLDKLLGLEAPAGSFFSGTATFPPVSCEFAREPLTFLFNETLLTTLFSGPDNPYSLSVTPKEA